MKPRIGITTYYVKSEEASKKQVRGLPGQDLLVSTMDYSRSVSNAGGIPLTIPVLENDDYIEEIVKQMDGFIFAGGTDVSPLEFKAPVKKGLKMLNPERDRFELKLLKKIIAYKKPILGICRGFQLINVFFGGTLYQDIEENGLTKQEHFCKMMPKYSPCHSIYISSESRLYSLWQKEKIMVNSFHHQTVKKLGNGLKELGKAEDGIIELIEHQDYPFLMAVQWHPEMMSEKYSEQLKVFELLIENCR